MLLFRGNGIEVHKNGHRVRVFQDGKEVDIRPNLYIIQNATQKQLVVPAEAFFRSHVDVSVHDGKIIVRRGGKLSPQIAGKKAGINIMHVLDKAGIRLEGKRVYVELVDSSRFLRVYKILKEGN